jgi:hypothetical protein
MGHITITYNVFLFAIITANWSVLNKKKIRLPHTLYLYLSAITHACKYFSCTPAYQISDIATDFDKINKMPIYYRYSESEQSRNISLGNNASTLMMYEDSVKRKRNHRKPP